MKQFTVTLMAVAAVAACNSNNPENLVTDVTEEGGVVITEGSHAGAVTLYETKDGKGGGWATKIAYDENTNTILIDGLPFDGANTYTVGSVALAGADIYNGPASDQDPHDSETITQFLHRALYKRSTSGNTEFGIVRSGEYGDYGFGGFVYLRDVTATLPTSGQAHYVGNYGGMRVYLNQTGLDYVTGNALAIVDFSDFNEGAGILITISNRAVWDINSVGGSALNITGDKSPEGDGTLPDLELAIAPGTIQNTGSIQGSISSVVENPDGSGSLITYESGTFNGLLAGDDAEELVGIVKVEGLDPEYIPLAGESWKDSTVTYQETGGFIAYR